MKKYLIITLLACTNFAHAENISLGPKMKFERFKEFQQEKEDLMNELCGGRAMKNFYRFVTYYKEETSAATSVVALGVCSYFWILPVCKSNALANLPHVLAVNPKFWAAIGIAVLAFASVRLIANLNPYVQNEKTVTEYFSSRRQTLHASDEEPAY